MKLSTYLCATALAGATALVPSFAVAQTQQQTDASATEASSGSVGEGDVVVTGSRIRRPNDDSTIPISTVTAAELAVTGRVSIGDTLNNLPQLQSTFSQSNSTRFLGTAGLNLLDLRGLGTQRTLVLVNGRRHVASDILNNAVSPDINTFPTDLIERVDTITGGSSSIYGSDAIAGVVNFVLKDSYEGVQLRGQGGISEHGDAGTYYGSLLAGKNFAQGRGNIAVNLEYARQNSFFASQRKDLSRADGFLTVDVDPTGLPNNSNGKPDNVFFRDIRSATINSGGLVAFGSPTGACGRDAILQTSGLGRPFTCNYLFQPDGSLVAQTGTRVGTAASATSPNGSSFIGGNGNTRREGQLVQLLPQQDRYSANLIGHFDITDALVPFIEAKYVRINTFGTGSSGPAFSTGATFATAGTGGTEIYERPTLDNPFLSAQARTTITNALIASGVNAADITGGRRFTLRKNLLDLGVRNERSTRETYRVVGGIRGSFNDDWNYELSANYGEFQERTRVLGNLNQQRFLLSMDAQRNAAGQIVCGSQIDASRAGTDIAGNAANLANDIAACVPYNPFGDNASSQAARNYLLQNTTSVGKITQFVASGFVAGDLSQLFELPGGPIGFAVGGEYRRETNEYRQDPLVKSGYTFYNAIADFVPPAFEVKEAYTELRVPLLKDLPLIQSLELTGAARVADYRRGGVGTVWSYNGAVNYQPVEDLRFRANYARSVRAPNLNELFSPQSQNFASVSDPCSFDNLSGGTTGRRAANCAAQGIPTSYNYVYQQTLEIRSGGNPDLREEDSDSYTYGVVATPRWVPGLTLSVDYYNIKVNNVISAVDAQSILDQCYDAPSIDNQFCATFQRVGAGQTGPNGEQAYRIIEGSLLQSSLNYARLRVRGIDTDISYSHRFGGTQLTSHFVYSHQLENAGFLDPTQPGFADNYLGELSQPRDAFNWNLAADFGKLFGSIELRYLSKMSVGEVENRRSFQGRPPQNLDDYDIPFYPDVFYANLRFGVNINDKSNFYMGIDNVTDRMPPLGSTGIGFGSGIYENVGRRFYAGIVAGF
ncbi:outer membrane receptor protein involved in Fe transport [Sphingomonas sp. BE138]|uniref:TonB-dependent receptor domain-containing protein n=1 Tax=Sphingomonas sp. BE138 TaxID=2817845 RepID=UPI00285D8BE2|nr:TonB-dependent receptor [Sphingomonas sp. BE138]MDR6790535.1 outer membrane receptor protein involved in Fe transport [Sphingomonas sp. BE138]